MRAFLPRTHWCLSAAAALLLAGCGSPKPPILPRPVVRPAATDSMWEARTRAQAEEAARAAQLRAQMEAAARSDSLRALEMVSAADAAWLGELETPIYFGFDDHRPLESSLEEVLRKASLLRSRPEVRLRITGHTDERGYPEYNLALAQRRAESVRELLTTYGIAAERLEVVSFGEEMPVVHGAGTEDQHARNRRAEFVVTSSDRPGSAGSRAVEPGWD